MENVNLRLMLIVRHAEDNNLRGIEITGPEVIDFAREWVKDNLPEQIFVGDFSGISKITNNEEISELLQDMEPATGPLSAA